MLAQGAGDLLHGLDAGPHGLSAPLIEELASPSGRVVIPELLKDFLEKVSPDSLRIAKGVSQTELARRLGVSKQAISRYEETEYQTVAIARLQEILDAIGIKTLVTLSA